MTLEELKNKIPNLKDNGIFSFGFNWESYVDTIVNEDIINIHLNDLKKLYGDLNIDIKDKDVIDIGSGSGLSSLCLERMGVKKLVSIDIDKHSVNATTKTKEKFSDKTSDWEIQHKSVLDGIDEKFDLVYTWGVLHHTGNMWQAINVAANAVKPNGYLHIALYRKGPNYINHLSQKQGFASLSKDKKVEMLINYLGPNTNSWMTPYDHRGMTRFHDALDWLGGMPYEVCDPQELKNTLYNFKEIYLHPGAEGGNFISIMQKIS